MKNRIAPIIASLAVTTLVALAPFSVPALAQDSAAEKTADRNTARINAIINGLAPGHYKKRRSKSYRKRVRKIIPRHRKGGYGRPVIVDYNRSVSLEIFFAHNRTKITSRARKALDDLGYALVSPRLRNSVYLLAGHTSARGKAGYNQWLSEERARAAKTYLVRRFNISPDRLVTTGFGEERLLNRRRPNSSVNRRVEISLIERGQPSGDDPGSDAYDRIIK